MPKTRTIEVEGRTLEERGPVLELPNYGDAYTELSLKDEPTIDWYINQAVGGRGLRSESELAAALNVSRATVSHWRQKKAWPSESVMLRLANYAGVDQDEALLHLAIWRAKQPDVRRVLTHILGGVYGIKSAMTALFFAFIFASFLASPAEAAVRTYAPDQCILWKIRRACVRGIKSLFRLIREAFPDDPRLAYPHP